jgi:hypothetical protein
MQHNVADEPNPYLFFHLTPNPKYNQKQERAYGDGSNKTDYGFFKQVFMCKLKHLQKSQRYECLTLLQNV